MIARRNPEASKDVPIGEPTKGDHVKTMLRRLLILAAPIIWRKIRNRRRGR
jgi:hypothetical protein